MDSWQYPPENAGNNCEFLRRICAFSASIEEHMEDLLRCYAVAGHQKKQRGPFNWKMMPKMNWLNFWAWWEIVDSCLVAYSSQVFPVALFEPIIYVPCDRLSRLLVHIITHPFDPTKYRRLTWRHGFQCGNTFLWRSSRIFVSWCFYTFWNSVLSHFQ